MAPASVAARLFAPSLRLEDVITYPKSAGNKNWRLFSVIEAWW